MALAHEPGALDLSLAHVSPAPRFLQPCPLAELEHSLRSTGWDTGWDAWAVDSQRHGAASRGIHRLGPSNAQGAQGAQSQHKPLLCLSATADAADFPEPRGPQARKGAQRPGPPLP